MEELRPGESIKKAHIPDDDLSGWMNLFREVGIPENESEEILSRLNTEYGRRKMSARAREIAEKIIARLKERRGDRKVTKEDIEYIYEQVFAAEGRDKKKRGKD